MELGDAQHKRNHLDKILHIVYMLKCFFKPLDMLEYLKVNEDAHCTCHNRNNGMF